MMTSQLGKTSGLIERVAARHRLLVLLLTADLVFIVLYGLYGFDVLHDPKLGLIEDWSYGEVFQYVKELWMVVLLIMLAMRWRQLVFFAWMAVFAYLLADDAGQIHERAGAWIAGEIGLEPRFGLRAVDFGELAVTAAAGTMLMGFVLAAHRYATIPVRVISRRLAILLALLVFFGVVIDMFPGFESPELLGKVIGAIEDGGEMVVLSLAVAYVFGVAHRDGRAEPVTP